MDLGGKAAVAAAARAGHQGQRGRAWAWLLALAWLQVAALVATAPGWAARVHLRVRTQLALQWVPQPAAVELSGRLTDAAGRGVAAMPLAVAVVVAGGARRTAAVTTDGDGRWRWVADLPELAVGSEVHVEASFQGDASRGESRTEQTFDIRKQQVQLQVLTPQKRWLVGGGLWTATLRAQVAGAPLVGGEAEVLLDGKVWQRLYTDTRGEVVLQRPVAALGALGPHQLVVRLAETAQTNAAQESWTVELAGALEVKLQAIAGTDEPAAVAGAAQPQCGEGDWCLQGRVLIAGTQQPVANAAVSLFAAQRQLGALASDADGRFAAVLRGEALTKLLRQTEIDVAAQASVGLPWIDSGWSEVVTLRLPEPTRWVEWSGGVALVLLVAAAAVRQWYLRRRRDAQARLAEAEQAGLPAESFVPGAATLEPCRALRATVLHGETGRPCAAAVWLARTDGGQPSLPIAAQPITGAPSSSSQALGPGEKSLSVPQTNSIAEAGMKLGPGVLVPCPHGLIDLRELQDGSYTLLIQVEEHEQLTLALGIPHLGAFDGCELRPASCRAVVRGSLAAALRRLTGVGVDWGRETPRVVEPRWAQHAKRGRVEIREAVRTSEKALYGANTSPAVVAEVKGALVRVEEAQK